jgi:hypothetical protein
MVESIPYSIIKKIDSVELRHYPEVLLAVVEKNDDAAFGLLFQYITGENTTQRRIPMTAPVITSEKIPMTAPVITRKNHMAFAIPASYTKETIPIPTNPAVKIETQKEKTMAVLRFSGRTSDIKVQKYIQELLTILKKHNIKMKGQPILMRYNSPFTPGFLRRNEVAVEINEIVK